MLTPDPATEVARTPCRAGVGRIPNSGRTLTSDFHALISHAACASTSALVTGPAAQNSSRPFEMVLKAVSLLLREDTELDSTSTLSCPRCSEPFTSLRAICCSRVQRSTLLRVLPLSVGALCCGRMLPVRASRPDWLRSTK